MRVSTGFALFFALALPASGHVLDKTNLQIGVGEQTTFTLSDASGCFAEIQAIVNDPSIARVSPDEDVIAMNQTFTVTGLKAGSTHITVYWEANDGYSCYDQGNARVNVTVTGAEPEVLVASRPSGIAQETSVGGSSESFALANVGGAPSAVTLTPAGGFFSLAPTTATIPAGASQVFTITGIAQPQGFYEGSIVVSGPGVPANTSIPVRLISANRPSEPPLPRPTNNRVDLTTNAATITFTNDGPGTVRGVFFSDVPWIIPPQGVFQFGGHSSSEVQIGIDPASRPAEISVAGSLGLQYLLSPGEIAKTDGSEGPIGAHDSVGTSTTTVSVVSTAPPGASPATIPPLGPQEVALFAPGIGRIVGSVGLYISDVTLTSLLPTGDLRNVRLYYTPIGGNSLTTNIATVSPTLATPLGDLVKGVFAGDAQIGSLQVRTPDVANLSVTASIFNSSDPLGTFGTGIPIFRSDRGVRPGEQLVLTGLRKTATSHTNLYVQETSGNPTSTRITWLAADGSNLGQRSVELGPFAVALLNDPLPNGAVSAVVEHESGAAGTFAAYATPVDRASGDFWAVADWVRQYGANPFLPLIVPVAGHAPGANNTQFRTDISVVNSGTSPGSGTLRYTDSNGATFDRDLTLAAGQTLVYEDVTQSLFGIEANTVGYLRFTPGTGSLRMTSRTYNLVADGSTYGSGVPAQPLAAALSVGQRRRFGGIDDSALATINAGRPATFRSNVGLVEASGQPVRLRATLNYTVPSALVTAFGSATKEYTLQPGQFRQVQRIATDILGGFRASFGDLRNMQLEIEVLEGPGSVLLFVSTTDNGTGDSILRTE